MAERTRCEICNREFKDMGGLAGHNKAKHSELWIKPLIKAQSRRFYPLEKTDKTVLQSSVLSIVVKPKKMLPIRKIRNWNLFIIALVVIIVITVLGISSIERLPPIDMAGHIESNPVSHILKEPMPIAIQKHMLEHADGIEKGRGGVIINYNCKDYVCEPDLIGNLETFAIKYNYVYVAPFKGMNAKIVLTKLNKREILEEYNNETIEKFIKY